MKKFPSVGVVIPAKNRPEFLISALKSVLDQKFKKLGANPIQEIWVIDDGSVPSLKSQMPKTLAEHSLIHWLRFENSLGGNIARNAGWKRCTSEWIAFLDDDDLWHPEKIEQQILKITPQSVLIFTARQIFKNHQYGKIILNKESWFLKKHTLLWHNYVGPTSSVLIRKESLEKVGGFNEKLSIYQDWELYLKLLPLGEFLFCAQALTHYRIHTLGRVSAKKYSFREVAQSLIQTTSFPLAKALVILGLFRTAFVKKIKILRGKN